MKWRSTHTLKQILSLLLALMMLLSLAACGSAGTTKEETSTDEPAAEEPETKKPDDSETLAPAEDATVQNKTDDAAEETETEPQIDPAGDYSLVQNVYNWGSSYSKVILPLGAEDADYTDAGNYTVSVWRYDMNGSLLNHGERAVTGAYASDAQGVEDAEGGYVTLEMEIIPADGVSAPYYTEPDSYMGQLKSWAECSYTVTNTATGEIWNQLDTVYHPDEAGFETGAITEGEFEIPYASYSPEADGEKHPLVVWLHGAGSGGTDIGFVTGGMLVTNFISEDAQDIFGGAYVLLPQCKTVWMDDGSAMTSDGSSIYIEPLMAMIQDYVAQHPDVDTDRIYLGGCSNGGYMTLALAIQYPDYFAAAFPVCEAYQDAWITDDQIDTLKDQPLWFVHSTNDPVVDVTTTSVPTYERLIEAGAQNVHFTTYDKIVDPDYGNEYAGHFAWVYALKNLCSTDYDGGPVTIDGQEVTLFQWLAAQSK